MKSVKFGLIDGINFNTNSAIITAFHPINSHEYLAMTRNGLFKFEDESIKKIYPYKLATSIIIPEYKFIVGVSSLGGEILVLMIDELDSPVFSHFKTDQLNIFHMMYSHKSHSLITVGSGIKIWNFNVKMPHKVTLINRPEITIKLRAQIAPEYDTPILNPPSIDYDQELLCLPNSNGFCGYNFDGKEIKYFSKVEATAQTAASLCNENKKFLTAQHGDGFHLWSKKGYLVRKIPGGMSSVLALRYINKHFALFLDSNLWVFIIDIRTTNVFHCFTLSSKPSYFNVYRDSNTKQYFLVISQGCIAKRMEIVLPWTVWKKMTTQPYSIRRCPKYKEAARILTYYKSSIFSFLSPKDGKSLTSAVDTQPSGPLFHYYDRGLLQEPIFDPTNSYIEHTNAIEISKKNKRDVLFVTTAEANTSLFSTGNNPCQLAKIIEIQISSITVCEIDGTFMYCFSNLHGELLFHNYSDFLRVNRKLILKKPIKRIFYHRKSCSIIIVFQDEVHLFDLNTFKDVQKISIKDGSYSEFYGNLLLIGGKSGNIESIRISLDKFTNNYRLVSLTDDCIHYHDDEITAISFSPTFFISSSLDKTLKVWNYNFNLLYDIKFPFPLFSCEILNAQRDILVGTDNEILKIDGPSLFGINNTDDEIGEIDNTDQISDELTNQLIQFAVEKNKEEQSDFLTSRMKNKEETTKQPRKKLNAYMATHRPIQENENEDQSKSKNKDSSTAELSEDERNRRLYEMNLINERSDNEKLQAKLRAEMRMKMDEEERKRKLKEAEEEAIRREMKEEEEEEKNEEKEKKRKKRRKNRPQKVQIEQDNSNSNDKNEIDDFDDLFFKKKKSEVPVEDEFKFRRKKAVYQPKSYAPRSSRPFRTNAEQQQQQQNEDDNDDEYEYEYEIDDDEINPSGNTADSVSKLNKRKRKRKNGKEIKDSENNNQKNMKKKKDNKKPGKRKNKKNSKGENNDSDNGYEYEEDDNENDILNEDGNNDEILGGNVNKNDNENENAVIDENLNEDGSNESDINAQMQIDGQNNFEGDESQSIRPQMYEVDTQTSFPYKDEKLNEKGNNGGKEENIATNSSIHQKIPHGKSTSEQPTNDDSQANKKRSKNPKQGKQKSNSTEINNNNKQNNTIKPSKQNSTSSINFNNTKQSNSNDQQNNQVDSNKKSSNNKNNRLNNKTKQLTNKSSDDITHNINDINRQKPNTTKNKRRQEQIFLTHNIKRSPTPPARKLYYTYNPNFVSKNKTISPTKSFFKFRNRYPLRRCRTPPVLQQEKLIILPGPEVVLDMEAIIDQILDGKVELMPLLRRMNANNRSVWIQRLKGSSENRKAEIESNPPPQFHKTQFNFPSSSKDDQQEANKEGQFGNSGNFSFNMNPRSNFSEESKSMQFEYPPSNHSSRFVNPLNSNFTAYNQITSQKVEYNRNVLSGEDDRIHALQPSDQSPLYAMNALNRYQPKNSETVKKKRQKQVSILNLDFDVQNPARPLNMIGKKEGTLPKVHRPVNNYPHSPRRNLNFQRKVPLFDMGRENGKVNTKSYDNLPHSKIGAAQKNKYQKIVMGPARSSSPPPLYRPRISERSKNNLHGYRKFQ